MSEPTLPPINPRLGLMFAAAHHLLPLFKIGTIDDRLARQMAVSAIEAYEPQTRADYVNVARIIAFSMTALVLLGKTVNPDMPMPEQMRAYGRANALNRSTDQSERTMMQRRRLQKANPLGERPDLIGPNPTIPDPAPPRASSNSRPDRDRQRRNPGRGRRHHAGIPVRRHCGPHQSGDSQATCPFNAAAAGQPDPTANRPISLQRPKGWRRPATSDTL
jgi:hypothetical protein